MEYYILLAELIFMLLEMKLILIDFPGIATAMKRITSFNDDFVYYVASWRIKLSSNITNKEVYFSAFIPLLILGS